MTKTKARIINGEAVDKNTTFQPPLRTAWGVDKSTCEINAMTLTWVIIPPGGRNQAHYHANCDAAVFVRKGTIKIYLGEEREEHIVPVNHFVFFPRGEIHGVHNISDTETAELIATYSCPSRDTAGTVFVEDPWVT